MNIEKVHVSWFKGFKDFELICLPFTSLVGPNNSGKTSILQAIQLFHNIFIYSLGNGNTPNLTNFQESSDPSSQITKVSFGDPDAIWLQKNTTNPCKITVVFSNGYEVYLEISGLNRYKINIQKEGLSLNRNLNEPSHAEAITEIYNLKPLFVPSMSAVSSVERFIAFPNLQNQLNEGRATEIWRANIYWQYNNGAKDTFDKAVTEVRRYLPNVRILPPKLDMDHTPKFLIQYEEDETIFDIGVSGSGLRTLLGLAVVLHTSDSKCMLFDEPDAHLHGTLQRIVARMLLDHAAEHNLQIFTTSHAPDFVSEIPVDQLVWIDRTKRGGETSNELGIYLVELGSVTQAEAIKAYGANKILFVEGKLDKDMLSQMLDLARIKNPFKDKEVVCANLPNGKGDQIYLLAHQGFLRETFKMRVKIACVKDRDYELNSPSIGTSATDNSPLIVSLTRKEIENYFLDPKVIHDAVQASANKRQKHDGEVIQIPSPQEIEDKLHSILDEPEIKNHIKHHVIPQFRKTLSSSKDDASKEKESEDWFNENWTNRSWQLKQCPGKTVLRLLRSWLQKEYKLTISDTLLIDSLNSCPDDILELGKKLEGYFYSSQ